MEYKCPACNGTMIFDSKTQKMKCPYCDTEMDIEAFERMQKEKTAGTASENVSWMSAGNSEWQAGETNGMRIYACKSCGGEIVADESTGASMCPFKLDKKAAKDAYHRHLKGKYFMPRVFKEENHIDEIKGVYVPFWLFDADVSASANFEASKDRSWRNGDMEYTEHEIYRVDRAGSFVLNGSEDRFVKRTVTSRPIVRETEGDEGSSGGSTTHTSSSGTTHGGSGGKF